MVKYVLIPNRVRFDIAKELAVTFEDIDDSFEIINLVDDIFVRNYADMVQVLALENKMKEKISELKKNIRDGDEVYLIASGSAFHNGLAVQLLIENGIDFTFLVYERRVGKYAVIRR